MNESTALTKFEPLRPLNPGALPTYFSRALAERLHIRSAARTQAVGEGMGAAFFTFLTCVFGYLSTLLWQPAVPLVMLAVLSAGGAAAAMVIAMKEGWNCLDRIGFLRGTRDETKYLPARCREFSEAEISLSRAFDEIDAAAVRWNGMLPELEAHGTPWLRALALDHLEKLEARRRTIAVETARLWTLAANSTLPELPPKHEAKRLPDPADS